MLDSWLNKTKLRLKIERFVEKRFYGRFSPNQLTVLGLILGLLSAVLIFLSGIITEIPFLLIIIACILMSLSFLFDVFDGALARVEEPTIFGGIFDIFCDRLVEVSIIIAIISTDPLSLMWPGIFLLGAIIICITMFLAVGGAIKLERINETKKVIYYRKGLMERSETFLFLLLITLIFFGPWRCILLWIFTILVFLTGVLRLRDAYLILRKPKQEKKNL